MRLIFTILLVSAIQVNTLTDIIVHTIGKIKDNATGEYWTRGSRVGESVLSSCCGGSAGYV